MEDVMKLKQAGKRGVLFRLILDYLWGQRDNYEIITYGDIIDGIGEPIPIDQENPAFIRFRSTLCEVKTVLDSGFMSFESIAGVGIRQKRDIDTMQFLAGKRLNKGERQIGLYYDAVSGRPLKEVSPSVLQHKAIGATWARRALELFNRDDIRKLREPTIIADQGRDAEQVFERRKVDLA